MGGMSPKHSGRRADVYNSPAAQKQIDAIGDEDELRRLDRTLAAISADPTLGQPMPRQLRDFHDEVERTRVIYFATVRGSVVIVAYLEV